jgi:hypothetical protein
MENIKLLASQAKHIYRYNSLRFKILKCNADIFFNRQCLATNIIPKYANVKSQLVSFKYLLCSTVKLIKVNIIHLTHRDGKHQKSNMIDDVKILLKICKLQLIKRCVYILRMEGWLETRRN